MDRIVLAVDGSECSRRAARLAGQLSRCLDTEVDVLHVIERAPLVPPEVVDEFERIEHTVVTHEELLRSAGSGIVDRAATEVREGGGVVRKSQLLTGRPAREIVDYAEDEGADVIVMGRRGLGGVRSVLLGSVTNEVAHRSARTLVTIE